MGTRGCDVAVIGGGLVGTALAYHLTAAGADVLLLDRHHPGRATDAGAGILSPETAGHPDPRWAAMARAAAAHYRSLVPRLAAAGAPDTGYARCGLLSVALDEREHRWFAEAAAAAEASAPGSLEPVSPAEARRLFPALGPVSEAAYCPGAARVDGRLMAAALRRAAEDEGLRCLEGTALGVEGSGDRVTAVRTAEGPVPCAALAVAGGAWTPPLGDELGLRVPVTPMKGQIVHLRADGADSATWPIVQPVAHHYLVSWPDGRVACGGTFEQAGFDSRVTAAGLRELLRECLLVAPGLADATVAEVRVGLRPVTPDDLPVLGPVPGWSNAYLATGHGANGLLLGPHNAAVVARAIAAGTGGAGGGATPPDGEGHLADGEWLAMCSPGRFGEARAAGI